MLFCLQKKHARAEQCLFLIPCFIDWRVFYCLKCGLSVLTPHFFKTSPSISGKNNIKNIHHNMVHCTKHVYFQVIAYLNLIM